VAAIKKEMDISIGNLVGSNVFNILGVLGVASLIRPIQILGGFIGI
jgi:cation:H+ antiporter